MDDTYFRTMVTAHNKVTLNQRVADLVERGWEEVKRGSHSEETTTVRKVKHWAQMQKRSTGGK